MTIGSPLTPTDLQMFAALGIDRDVLERAQVRRVSHAQARDDCGIRYHSNDLAGVAFPYVDPINGNVVGYRVRRDHPEVKADGTPIAKYLFSLDRRHLYVAPTSATHLTDIQIPAILCEAEKSALAITAAARDTSRSVLAIATGGCYGWTGIIGKTTNSDGTRVDQKGPLPDFDRIVWAGRIAILCFDENVSRNAKVQKARADLAHELAQRGAIVRLATLPTLPGVNGPDDYIGRHGAVAFFELIDHAPRATKTRTKTPASGKAIQGREVTFEAIEPWPEPVDGAALLDNIASTFERFLVFPKPEEKTDTEPADNVKLLHTPAATMLAPWVLHAWTLSAFYMTPFLAVNSPEKRCGKTLLLITLGALVPRRLFASNITPSALFRAIEKYTPSLLIDEADLFVRDDEELRGLLNSGHTRSTAMCVRAVGDDHEPRIFSTWCPKAIALIGRLPGTLEDRSIPIGMKRRSRSDKVERLRQDTIDSLCADLRRQAARWAADHLAALAVADPEVPGTFHDRAADCVRPLLAIADEAGAPWPEQAREAARVVFSADPEEELGTELLADLRDIFKEAGDPNVLASKVLLAKLVALEDRPWLHFYPKTGKPLTPHKMAALLKPYGIHSAGNVRVEDKVSASYRRAAFVDAWERYLSITPSPTGDQSVTRNNSNDSLSDSQKRSVTPEEVCYGSTSVTNAANTDECNAVTDRTTRDKPSSRKKPTQPGGIPDDGRF
jgi:hypothetical protein